MIRILLVDDHDSFRRPLAFMLNREPDLEVVGHVGTVADARPHFGAIDVALVDLDFPDADGTDLIRELWATRPAVAVLVVTGSDSRKDEAVAVEAGAAGVLHKSVSIPRIIEAIRRLHAGDEIMGPEQRATLLQVAGRFREGARAAERIRAGLTPRELTVLRALVEGLDDEEIARRLGLRPRAVRRHVGSICAKFGVDARLQAVVFAVRRGLVPLD